MCNSMIDGQSSDKGKILKRIRQQAAGGEVRVTQHAHIEMIENEVSYDDVVTAIASEKAEILENYSEHRRGACCLLGGSTNTGRALHVVCTTAQTQLIIITVYEPKPPKWVTPRKRGVR